jgi:uncharacterized membrane protein
MTGENPRRADLSEVTWSVGFRLRQYLKGSIWFFPLVGAILGPLLGAACIELEHVIHLPASWRYSQGTASTVLAAIVGSMVGLLGFVVTVSVLVVQSATGTLSPRFMRIWYRDRLQKWVLGVFVCTLTFSFSLLRELGGGTVPNLGVTVAGLAVTVSLVLLTVYLDRFVHVLRPVACGALVARASTRALEEASHRLSTPTGPADVPALKTPDLVVTAQRAGAIQAINVDGLLTLAHHRDGVFNLPHSIGDFVPAGAALVEIHGVDAPLDERRLRNMFALGLERTIDQDPAFGLRIMVDIAIKALSPAINDPTTAVQLLGYIEDLLNLIGSSALPGRLVLPDDDGDVRVVIPGRTWEDFLGLGVTEIRRYGSGSLQVCRRLRAVLETLRANVRSEHRPAVEAQMSKLDAAVARSFSAEDVALAMKSDRQGLGGPAETADTF